MWRHRSKLVGKRSSPHVTVLWVRVYSTLSGLCLVKKKTVLSCLIGLLARAYFFILRLHSSHRSRDLAFFPMLLSHVLSNRSEFFLDLHAEQKHALADPPVVLFSAKTFRQCSTSLGVTPLSKAALTGFWGICIPAKGSSQNKNVYCVNVARKINDPVRCYFPTRNPALLILVF